MKGSEKLVELFQSAIAAHHLAGSFCTGRCNRVGVTIIVDDEVFPGITPDGFDSFFTAHVLNPISHGEG